MAESQEHSYATIAFPQLIHADASSDLWTNQFEYDDNTIPLTDLTTANDAASPEKPAPAHFFERKNKNPKPKPKRAQAPLVCPPVPQNVDIRLFSFKNMGAEVRKNGCDLRNASGWIAPGEVGLPSRCYV